MRFLIFILLGSFPCAAQRVFVEQSSKRQRSVIYYFPVLGQSQAGAYNNAPALTTTTNPYVKTLTNGPIDVSTTGDLVPLVEGDTFDDTNGPAPTSNVETIATSTMQQLRIFRNSNPSDLYVCTVHARGGETIQNLSKGGSTGRYEEIISCINRLKVIADSRGAELVINPIFFHGGTGDNIGTAYEAKLLKLYTDFNADITAITAQKKVFLFTHQQRVVGTPDYGQQQVSASIKNPDIVFVAPEYPLLLSLGGGVAYQGDAIHITNHGTRYLAMHWAKAIWRKLFIGVYDAVGLNANATAITGPKQLTIPITGATGAIVTSSNCGIEVFSNTTSAVLASSVTVSGTNLIIDFTAALPPIGLHSLEIRTGVAANGNLRDSESSTYIPSFNNSSASPYTLNKYMSRAAYTVSLWFPVNYIANFGGVSANPNVAGTYSIWDNAYSATDVTYTLQGNVKMVCFNNNISWWGFVSKTIKGGEATVTGTNLYNNAVVGSWWFVESNYGLLRMDGFNPNKMYKIIIMGIRPAVATFRESQYILQGTNVVKQSNRAGTASIITTEAECAVFDTITPDKNGQILLSVKNQTDVFGYLNSLEIVEL